MRFCIAQPRQILYITHNNSSFYPAVRAAGFFICWKPVGMSVSSDEVRLAQS